MGRAWISKASELNLLDDFSSLSTRLLVDPDLTVPRLSQKQLFG